MIWVRCKNWGFFVVLALKSPALFRFLLLSGNWPVINRHLNWYFTIVPLVHCVSGLIHNVHNVFWSICKEYTIIGEHHGNLFWKVLFFCIFFSFFFLFSNWLTGRKSVKYFALRRMLWEGKRWKESGKQKKKPTSLRKSNIFLLKYLIHRSSFYRYT
jgi:hypothetical protein